MDEFNFQNDDNESGPFQPPEAQKRLLKPKVNPYWAAFLGLAGGFFLYQIVGGLLTVIIFNFDIKNAPVNSMRLMTMGAQILFILLPALIFTKMFYEDVTLALRIKIPNMREITLFTIGIVILSLLLQDYIYLQNYIIETLAGKFSFVNTIKVFLDSLNELVEQTYGDLLSARNLFELFLVLIVVSVAPALCEEVMFRGYIQRSFEVKMPPFVSALLTAVFFGLYHFNPYGFVPLTALGFFFGYAAYKSGSIIVPMFLHFLNNFTSVCIFIIFGNEDLLNSAAPSPVDIRISIIGFFILLFVFIIYLYLMSKYYNSNEITKEGRNELLS
jgi:membrane protease YdiL (CAAX protease family)